ncbi:MAG TPA: hypothetical protein VEV39_14495 [Gemmatimonadales bacterium]|nr:hypothetical protein [Gemmatimonadales bacterium]
MSTGSLTHETASDRGLVERYVAGRMNPDEIVTFEGHLITCAECQHEVSLGLAIRAALSNPRSRRGSWYWAAGIGLAAAAGIASLVVLRAPAPLTRLGSVRVPPVYLGVPVRTASSTPDSIFTAAMSAYVVHDYARASDGLNRVLSAGADSAPALFFLGAAELMREHPRAARDALREVVQLGESPYTPEARYYLAKALLRLGDGSGALLQLRAILSSAGIGPAATALADSVERLNAR